MTTSETEAPAIIWTGAGDLRALLVDAESVRVHPHDARRGNREKVADSLARFGQLKPIVVDGEGTILAGSQVHAAAVERLGWTHVAAVTANHLDPVDAFLYLLADNDASDESTYDAREAQVAVDGLRALVAAAQEQLDATEDQAARDLLAERVRALEDAALVLADHASDRQAGGQVDPDAIEATFHCLDPACVYEWRGPC